MIGYGIKTDPATGRNLNLDNTYNSIIKPVFEDLRVNCFRAKDILHSGIIDSPMYEWILKADLVLADLSTLNPNVLYELGVRHALRPFSTIVISEDKLKYPFDLSHTLIDPVYHHLGEDIGVQEASRFKQELKKKVKAVLKDQMNDSPVYTYLKSLNPPSLTDAQVRSIKESQGKNQSLSKIIEAAERAKDKQQYGLAENLFRSALRLAPNNSFLLQRLALVTYKSQRPTEIGALRRGLKVLNDLTPTTTTDPETLGLGGAIYKRLFEHRNKREWFELSLWFYERGFYVRQDYYNGINVAYLYTLSAARLQSTRDEAMTDFLHANRIRRRVLRICDRIRGEKSFRERGDKHWILLTMAEAYFGVGDEENMNAVLKEAKAESRGKFDLSTFQEQKRKLQSLMREYRDKWITL